MSKEFVHSLADNHLCFGLQSWHQYAHGYVPAHQSVFALASSQKLLFRHRTYYTLAVFGKSQKITIPLYTKRVAVKLKCIMSVLHNPLYCFQLLFVLFYMRPAKSPAISLKNQLFIVMFCVYDYLTHRCKTGFERFSGIMVSCPNFLKYFELTTFAFGTGCVKTLIFLSRPKLKSFSHSLGTKQTDRFDCDLPPVHSYTGLGQSTIAGKTPF